MVHCGKKKSVWGQARTDALDSWFLDADHEWGRTQALLSMLKTHYSSRYVGRWAGRWVGRYAVGVLNDAEDASSLPPSVASLPHPI